MYLAGHVGMSRPRNLPLQSTPREPGWICGFHGWVGGWMDRDKQTHARRCVLNDAWLFVSQGAPAADYFCKPPTLGPQKNKEPQVGTWPFLGEPVGRTSFLTLSDATQWRLCLSASKSEP